MAQTSKLKAVRVVLAAVLAAGARAETLYVAPERAPGADGSRERPSTNSPSPTAGGEKISPPAELVDEAPDYSVI